MQCVGRMELRAKQQPVICAYCIVGAALQAVMDFFQILVTSGNSEVDFQKLFEVNKNCFKYIC